MPLWNLSRGVTWSFYRNRLYHCPFQSGEGHSGLHLKHNMPMNGPAFDLVERGRACLAKTITGKTKLIIEVASSGKKEFISNEALQQVMKVFGVDSETTDVEIHDPKEYST